MAAFGATGVENLATTAGFHAGAKAVRPFAFQIAGLESTFHDLNHCLSNDFIGHWGRPICPEKGRQQYCAGRRLSTVRGQNPA